MHASNLFAFNASRCDVDLRDRDGGTGSIGNTGEGHQYGKRRMPSAEVPRPRPSNLPPSMALSISEPCAAPAGAVDPARWAFGAPMAPLPGPGWSKRSIPLTGAGSRTR